MSAQPRCLGACAVHAKAALSGSTSLRHGLADASHRDTFEGFPGHKSRCGVPYLPASWLSYDMLQVQAMMLTLLICAVRIRTKARLVVCDSLSAYCHGEHSEDPLHIVDIQMFKYALTPPGCSCCTIK